jgi:hypothetical protein
VSREREVCSWRIQSLMMVPTPEGRRDSLARASKVGAVDSHDSKGILDCYCFLIKPFDNGRSFDEESACQVSLSF